MSSKNENDISFKTDIQQWVSIDNELKLLNNKIKELRDKKSKLSDNIIVYAGKNNYTNSTIQINDGKVKIVNTLIQPPLTFKYLHTTLGEIIKNEKQLDQIIHYIKEKREAKNIMEIKRFYNS
jgi:hypothetical protein